MAITPHPRSGSIEGEWCYRRGFSQGFRTALCALGLNQSDFADTKWALLIDAWRGGRRKGRGEIGDIRPDFNRDLKLAFARSEAFRELVAEMLADDQEPMA
jgi:hypothetical protein